MDVAEYVLPKFKVTIDSANDFSVRDGKVRAIIRAKYTYGKFVKGEAVVSLTPQPTYHYWAPRVSDAHASSYIKSVPIDGKGSVEFDVQKDFDLENKDHSTLRYTLRATVAEELTGRNQSADKSITVHSTRYKFHESNIKHEFTAGLPVVGLVRKIMLLRLFKNE